MLSILYAFAVVFVKLELHDTKFTDSHIFGYVAVVLYVLVSEEPLLSSSILKYVQLAK